jgi:hypothetical protein
MVDRRLAVGSSISAANIAFYFVGLLELTVSFIGMSVQ